jgi:hypothetical protein
MSLLLPDVRGVAYAHHPHRSSEMVPMLNELIATQHTSELRRAAELRRKGRSSSGGAPAGTLELRLARAGESQVVRRLAALDDAPELEGQALLAVVDGVAVAALSLSDRRVVANPFVATGDVVTLLRLRADHVLGPPQVRPLRRLHRLRAA